MTNNKNLPSSNHFETRSSVNFLTSMLLPTLMTFWSIHVPWPNTYNTYKQLLLVYRPTNSVTAEKYEFHTTSTTFLGYNSSHHEVEMNQTKVKQWLSGPIPQLLRNYRGFLAWQLLREIYQNLQQHGKPPSSKAIWERLGWWMKLMWHSWRGYWMKKHPNQRKTERSCCTSLKKI